MAKQELRCESHGSELMLRMATDLYRRVFARAADILGGRERLARYLGIDSQLLEKWSMPGTRPPEQVLQSVAQLLRRELLRNYKNDCISFSPRMRRGKKARRAPKRG